MNLNRIDLADIHHPRKLAKGVHDQLGLINTSVPVVDIAKALGIAEVKMRVTDSIEGMLITDRARSIGSILANTAKGTHRARFTVAHELGHFLLERHVFENGSFKCNSADIGGVSAGSARHQLQENEANEFAISLLAPPYLVQPAIGATPDLADALGLRDQLKISFEASVRLLISYRPEPIAAIWSKDGKVQYFVPSQAFPKLLVKPGHLLPAVSAASRFIEIQNRGVTAVSDTPARGWCIVPCRSMTEQTRLGRDGYAVTLLVADLRDDGDLE